MSSKIKTKKIVRPNPLISIVIKEAEFEELTQVCAGYGISMAQATRGYFRLGRQKAKTHKTSLVEISRLGVL